MKKEHRLFVILFVKSKWCVFYLKKLFDSFDTKKEAEEHRQFLRSR